MRNTVQKRFTQTVTVAVALMVVLSVFGLIGTVAAQDVSVDQSESEVTAAPGETVELTTTLSITDLNAHVLQVYLPGEWEGTITDADGGAPKPASGSGNPLEVVWVTVESSHEVTYEVHVPEDAAEGDYTVDVDGSAIVPDTGERVVESTQTTITVEQEDQNEGPTASFTVSPDSPEAGQEVTFDAAGSSDDSAIASYEWDVDGEPLGDDGEQATTSFDAAGEYDVTLTVTDDDGATDSTTQTVSVSEGSDDSDEDDSDDGDDGDDSDEDDSDDSDDSDENNSDDSDDADDGDSDDSNEDDSNEDDSNEDDSNEDDSDEQSGEDCSPEENESLDSDGDGLTDAEEKELGTDPYDADTDGDCVSDGDEVEAGTDPLCSTCC